MLVNITQVLGFNIAECDVGQVLLEAAYVKVA